MKSTVLELHNTLDEIKRRFSMSEEKISEFEDTAIETFNVKQREKRFFKNDNRSSELGTTLSSLTSL